MIMPGAKVCCPEAALLAPPTASCVCGPWKGMLSEVVHVGPEKLKTSLAGTFTEDRLKQPEMEPQAGIAEVWKIAPICGE